MGAFTSRRSGGVEEVDISTTNAYRYPPKSGTYFGSHYIMGGERFETTQPEEYLFGDNKDLNFLGNRPVPFPYPAPQAHEPTKTLKSLVNIRKDSIRFVKASEEEANKTSNTPSEGGDGEEVPVSNSRYNIEFTFDSDVRCAITVYYFATEEVVNKQLVYHPQDASMNSETFHYKRGANQTFNQATHILDPSKFPEEEWVFNSDRDTMPVVIHCVVEDEEYIGHSHVTFATVEKTSEGLFSLKPHKQKQMVDGLCYLLQEIYGIENKNTERGKQDEDVDDSGSECVICMCEMRDTIILPCRHLCLCNCCADNLRYQANNCPICRARFRALLQIRAMRKKTASGGNTGNVGLATSPTPPPSAQPQTETSEEPGVSQEGVPAGYEAVSLIEALNGPTVSSGGTGPHNPLHTHMHPDGENPGLDRLLAGNSTLRSTASSLPASPEGTPVIHKPHRKMKRQASQGSQHSRRSVPEGGVEEAREAQEGPDAAPAQELGAMGGQEDRLPTPEVCMTEQGPEPSKSPTLQTKVALPQVRYPPAKVDLVDEGSLAKPAAEAQDMPQLQMASSEEEQLSPAVEADRYERSGSPAPDYDDTGDELAEGEEEAEKGYMAYEVDEEEAGTPRTPAAHTTVLYDPSMDGERTRAMDDEEGLGLPQHLLDPLSLPGTPAGGCGGDGSSYSSTNSAHGLLAQTTPPKADCSDLDRSPVA